MRLSSESLDNHSPLRQNADAIGRLSGLADVEGEDVGIRIFAFRRRFLWHS